MNLPSTKISLYVHIPFCSSKCKYCDFYSETIGFDRIHDVVSQLIEQLENRYHLYNCPIIDTIFIGGGTPSILPDKELSRLLKYINTIAPMATEWSIESNPETITKEFLNIISNSGVNRLSLGVQSFNNTLLKTIGRSANKNQIEKAIKLIKEKWKGSFSLDLISSLPGQTEDLVEEDIKKALEYEPDHISFYALSLEEGTPLEDEISKGTIQELSQNRSENIWIKGREILNQAGYINYEVSNYTKNSPCLHNINYWELKPYLGIGPGAVSTIIDKSGKIARIENKKSITEFVKGRNSNWGEVKSLLTPKELFEDYIIMGLRLKEGINIERFQKIFNKDITDSIPILKELESEDLIIQEKKRLYLTTYGFDTMNTVLIRILESIEGVEINSANWFY